MKILVTGANGYLGRGIVKALLDYGVDVIANDFDLSKVDDRANKMCCDFSDVSNPYEYFYRPDVLLHLAWKDGFVHYSNAHIDELPKHYRFIKKMFESEISKIAVMGSMHEIGFHEGSIDETTPCHPESYYGIAKNALRNVVEVLAKKNHKDFQWLRAFYIVGNSLSGSSIFSKIAIAAEKGEKTFPFTMGRNQFDFLDYDVFCQMVARTIMQNEILGIINICSGQPEKLAHRVERFIADNNYDIKLEYGAFPDREYDSKAVWGNSRKIEIIMK